MRKYNYHTQDFRKEEKSNVAGMERRLVNRIGFSPIRLDRENSCSYLIDGRAFLGDNVIVRSENGLTPFAMNRVYSVSEYKIFGQHNRYILKANGGYFQPKSFYFILEVKGNKIIISNFKDDNGVVYYPHYRQRQDIKTQRKQNKKF